MVYPGKDWDLLYNIYHLDLDLGLRILGLLAKSLNPDITRSLVPRLFVGFRISVSDELLTQIPGFPSGLKFRLFAQISVCANYFCP